MHVLVGTTSRTLIVAALAAAIAVGCAACGSGASHVSLPPKQVGPRLAVRVPARASARQLIVAAYEGYWRATNQALATRSAAAASSILSGYVPAHFVPGLVKGLKSLWNRDEIGYGSPVFHIMNIKFTGRRTAAVHDCLDLSHTGFQDAKTGQIVGGIGPSHDYLITTLALIRGHWLVTGAIAEVRSCAY